MSKYQEYRVVKHALWVNGGFVPSSIDEEVSKLMADGWQPIGGIIFVDSVFYQAMVR